MFIPLRRYPGGFVGRCDGTPVTVPRDPVSGVLAFHCGRTAAEHLVEIAPAP